MVLKPSWMFWFVQKYQAIFQAVIKKYQSWNHSKYFKNIWTILKTVQKCLYHMEIPRQFWNHRESLQNIQSRQFCNHLDRSEFVRTLHCSFFLGPRGPLVEPSNPCPPVPSRNNFSWVHIYRHTCLMNHQKSHQTNPMAQRDPIDAPLTPWDPVGLPLDPLGPCRPTTWQVISDRRAQK